MKKVHVFALLVSVIVLSSLALTGAKQMKDGVYKGESQSKYTGEPYWGQITLEIKNDKVTLVSFQILDKDKNEVFGPDYERHFKDNAMYVDQCRNEVKGIRAYKESFLKTRDMDHVDAITGATWSYNIFRDALKAALEKAKQPGL
jgi:major membrane immunogen (membrane-anchored lipoprotein)